jgi:RNA polymerase-binding protein DksA
MARSSTRSLAGQAAQAARKVVSRRSKATAASGKASTTAASSKKTAATPAPKPAAKKTVTKKAAAKKTAPATKAATKKAPATKAPAKKAPAAKAPPTKAAAKKTAPAAKTAATKAAPASKTATKTVAKKAAPPKKASATKASVKPAAKAPAKKAAPQKTAPSTPAKKATTVNPPVTTKTTPAKPAKKVTATKATADNLAHLPREKAWTKAELAEVVADLHSDRERAIRTLTAQEGELAQLMRDAGDGAGHDQADMGATSFERDQELTVVNNEREKLAQIERALARIADGTYGTCESCGNPIGKGRAMAFPRATLCLTCKQREERR